MITCLKDLNQVMTLQAAQAKGGRNLQSDDLSVICDGAIIYDNQKILWVGESSQIPKDIRIDKTISLKGHVITPGLTDSHTHLVFGGNRSKEYTMRLNGADYQQIATAGGGILSTMQETLKLSEHELFQSAVLRVDRLYSYGVNTIEIKSGYALTYEGEARLTRVITKLKAHFHGKVQILNTFMAAHATPAGSNSKEYMQQIVLPLLEDFREHYDAVDIFFEQGYFDLEDTSLLIKKAKELSLAFKLHADEFNDNKGAVYGAKNKALSVDHLLCTSIDGIKALASSSTVATVLPGTAFFLGKPLADAKTMLDNGCCVAIASDYNPGSSHIDNLLLVASMAAKTMQFNIAQLWAAITLNSSLALGLKNQGALCVGMRADFCVFKCDSIDEITYSWGHNFCVRDF